MKASQNLNMNLQDLACQKLDDNLPWSHIDFGIDKKFFEIERQKANDEITTPDCSFGKCQDCGVCQNLGIKNEIAGKR